MPFFFYGGPGYHSTRSFQAAWDLGHILFFAIATVWVFRRVREKVERWPFLRLFLSFFAAVLIVGVLIEFLQSFISGRLPDVMDVLRNQLGCLIAFSWCIRPIQRNNSLTLHALFRGSSLLLFLVAVWPLTRAIIDESLATHQFPVLADFETPFERYRLINERQMQKETTLVRHGKNAMRVRLSTAKYSGVALFYFPGNWQGYNSLHYSVYNTQLKPLALNLRINDVEHKQHGSEFADRFNKRFSLQPGWNDLVVDLNQVRNAPKDRRMDMEHIEGLGLFVVQQAKPMEIIIDHIFLAR
ncbi:MAG: VanZ family protein [Desulfobulbus sp.]